MLRDIVSFALVLALLALLAGCATLPCDWPAPRYIEAIDWDGNAYIVGVGDTCDDAFARVVMPQVRLASVTCH